MTFTTDPAALCGLPLVIVAVGTLDATGKWTGDVVRRAVLAIAADPVGPRSIVIRSTLLPGTAAALATEFAEFDPTVWLAVNPEFTREGSAVADFLRPDRVIIGTDDPTAAVARDLCRIYEPLGAETMVTDLTSAEMIKVASNVYLAAKITFANELARLCEATGARVSEVVDGIGLDRRIGRAFLTPVRARHLGRFARRQPAGRAFDRRAGSPVVDGRAGLRGRTDQRHVEAPAEPTALPAG